MTLQTYQLDLSRLSILEAIILNLKRTYPQVAEELIVKKAIELISKK